MSRTARGPVLLNDLLRCCPGIERGDHGLERDSRSVYANHPVRTAEQGRRFRFESLHPVKDTTAVSRRSGQGSWAFLRTTLPLGLDALADYDSGR